MPYRRSIWFIAEVDTDTAGPPQMSIPVLITQTKKLKAHNKAKLERRCQYAPR